MRMKILLLQAGIVLASLFAVAEWALLFPFPSPVVKPFLPPVERWPTDQVRAWVESGDFSGDYLEFFARDPERTVPAGRNIVSPADGSVGDMPMKNGISYFLVNLSFWDVHVVRTPVAGVVKDVAQEGYYLSRDPTRDDLQESFYLRGKAAPVQSIVTLDTEYGEVKVRLITSYWASRLKVWVHEGQHLEKGQRIGRILLGSNVVAEFPGEVKFAVRPRQRVLAGETVIADGATLP